jgi:hypothetical protein
MSNHLLVIFFSCTIGVREDTDSFNNVSILTGR